MSNREPFLYPFRNLELTDDFWYSLLSLLIQESNHPTQLLQYANHFPHKRMKKFNLQDFSETTFPSLSLDETQSKTHLTPFHLSFFNRELISNKKLGQFFTPSYISEFIAKKSLDYYLLKNNFPDIEPIFRNIKIADIAAGTGNLLITFLYLLKDQLKLDSTKKKETFLSFISKNIFAFDLDSFALFIHKMRMLLFSSFFFPDLDLPDVDKNLCVGNSLLDDFSLQKVSSTPAFKPIEMLTERKSCIFDIIVSNPPYMSYGLRDAQKYHPEFKHFLRNRFFSAEYKLSLYPIFIERSLELLAHNGILGIITPDSHLLGRYYSKLRTYILENSDFLDISLLGFEPFQGVTLGRPIITFLSKICKTDSTISEVSFPARWISSLTSFTKGEWEEYLNSQTGFLENNYKRFHLYFNLQDKKYVEEWRQKAKKKLDELVTMHTGVRARIGQRNIVRKEKIGENWKQGLVSSSQIQPFHIEYQNDWINITPSILWSGGFDEDIVESPKIILRQTGYKIISAVDNKGYYHLNNCHTISPKNQDLNLYAISTQLNSIEFNKVYHILSMEKGRALAQVDMDFLLERFIIDLTKAQESFLEEFYLKQNQNIRDKKEIDEYSIFQLLSIV